MTGQSHRRATIHDVARQADVAVGTVSRYLNGLPVRGSNRAPIELAIAELGYRRSNIAVSMKTDTTQMVGLMLPTLSEFHAGLLEQLSRKMRLTGRAVISFCHDLEPRMIMEGLEFFANHRVDAVVMDANEGLAAGLTPFIEEGLTFVLYDNDLPGLSADRVFLDNRRTARRLTDHLVDLGHVEIAVIHGALRDSAGAERLQGWREAMAARGIAVRDDLVRDGNWNEADGHAAAEALMEMSAPPTAILSCNYNMTFGVLRCLRDRDLVLPRDLSLVSFDDVPAFTVHQPGITCAAQPVERMAEAITGIVAERLGDATAAGRRMLRLDGDIILRGSAGRPRAQATRRDGTWQR